VVGAINSVKKSRRTIEPALLIASSKHAKRL